MDSFGDRSVLLELFRVTNGPSWYNSDGWDTSTSIPTWYGVKVDEDGRIVKLELKSSNLEGPIPEPLGQLSNLTHLHLSGNKLNGAIPKYLGQLTNLTWLNLSYNQLTGAIPESFGQLTNLTWLSLLSNQLTGAIPECFGQLTNLTWLSLLSNQLTGAIPESFGQLINLPWLDLSNNQLTCAIPESLGQLTNMTRLILSDNQLTGAIPESLGQLTNLTRLVLSNNQLTGAIPESLQHLTKLMWLDFSSNHLTGAIPETLGQLTNLTWLSLSTYQLTGAIPESLGQLTNLTWLDLSNNQLTCAIPESLGQLTNLTWLDISNNQLTDIYEEAARGLQRLHNLTIHLGKNPWVNPPADIVDGGLKRIVGYWEAIARSGAIVSWKLKVVLVGAVKAGKTSLVKGMIRGQPHLCHEDDRTKGVDVHVSELCKLDAARKLELIFWDFAGHSEYFSTHQAFLSKGALHLLVVDLKRFSDESSARGELVDVWLDALQCRVPGSSILVVATQIDRFADDFEATLGDLRHRVESHLSTKRNDLERATRSSSSSSDIQRGLIFYGVETVSSARSESLMNLRFKLSKLVDSKRNMFPSVGRLIPVSWARVSAVLAAKRSGNDSILQASRIATVEHNQETLENITVGIGERFIRRVAAIDEWRQVVRTLKLEREVGSTVWDIATRKLKRSGNTERRGKKAIFEDAVEQLVREGTILDSGEVLYLEPTWINDLLRAILDHDLADVTKDDFWKNELKNFSGGNPEFYFDLKKIHDNFPSTGILTVRYLRFLWRDVTEIGDEAFFKSLLGTMSRHGVIFEGNPAGTSRDHAIRGLDDNVELFVPLHLPSNILVSDLKELGGLLKRQSRTEMVYEIDQTYVPPGVLGLLMARFIQCKGVKFRKCWSRGTVFNLAEVLVLLYLDTPSHGSEEAQITVNVFGERFVSEFTKTMHTVEHEIKSVFFEHFSGLVIGPKQGYPREFDGMISAIDGCAADGGCDIDGIISASDKIINAVVARIDGLETHLDRELSRMLQVLHLLEDKFEDMAKSCRTTLARLSELQSEDVPCPRLVIVRPAAAMVSGGQKRSLRAMVEGIGRRAKKLVCKDMRLCFLCPYDFSEVPCGLAGNGYPLTATREWVKAVRPVLKVTAVLAKVAIKAASGLDVPVSDFLNGAMSYVGEEVTDRVLDDDAVERALNGSTVPGEGGVEALVGEAYEELKKFMKEHENKDEGYVHYDKVMKVIDEEGGGKVWVSNKNVELWKKARA